MKLMNKRFFQISYLRLTGKQKWVSTNESFNIKDRLFYTAV
jgi:hypothetical protein